ncbi:VanZ family protein [Agromyces sp. CCNWLW203]|uniref:VanZ family protein n=1 Tax=Agromyces sp. CCNWLW203 TaxID=3112842 RepID=UPI002F96CE56
MSVKELPRSSAADGGANREPARGARRFVLPALFALYLVLLVWIVIWKLELPYVGTGELRQVKLTPFISDACNGASAPSEVVVNVVLFIPFGMYLGLLAPARPWWQAMIAIIGASLALEVAQFALAVGSSDLTDVITNTVGGLIGLVLLAIAHRRLGVRAAQVMMRVCAVVTVLLLVATAAFVASPLSFGPQQDVWVGTPGDPRTAQVMPASERDRMHRELRDPQC